MMNYKVCGYKECRSLECGAVWVLYFFYPEDGGDTFRRNVGSYKNHN
jgi:hypothetical protein